MDARGDIKNPYVFFEKITAILNQDLDFYSHLSRMRGNLSLSYKITTLLKKKILEPSPGAFLRPPGGGDFRGIRCVGNDGRV